MIYFKDCKFKVLVIFASFIFGSFSFADSIEFKVQMEAEVILSDFIVVPEGDWHLNPQSFVWNSFSGRLDKWSRYVYLKSNIGPINVYLVNEAKLVSGLNEIPIQVEFGVAKIEGVGIAWKKTILNRSIAAAGRRVKLELTPLQADGVKLAAGAYSAAVQLMIETAL